MTALIFNVVHVVFNEELEKADFDAVRGLRLLSLFALISLGTDLPINIGSLNGPCRSIWFFNSQLKVDSYSSSATIVKPLLYTTGAV